jgi:hypothetical protein
MARFVVVAVWVIRRASSVALAFFDLLELLVGDAGDILDYETALRSQISSADY